MPHITEELWNLLGHKKHYKSYVLYNPAYTVESSFEYQFLLMEKLVSH